MKTSFCALLGSGLVLLSACDPVSPNPPSDESAASIQPRLPTAFETIDDRFATIARSDPAFGGMYVDAQKRLNVLLTDTSRLSNVRSVIGQVFHERGFLRTAPVVAQPATYGFLQLYEWSKKLPELFSLQGALSFDIDEKLNRLVIGIESAATRSAVLDELTRLRIPLAAVLIRIEPRATLGSHTLQQSNSPRIGGLQIQSEADWICTLGFNARLGSNPTVYFATNGHCTILWGPSTDSTKFYQHLVSGGQLIGTEIVEAPFFSSAQDSRCPVAAGNRCKYTDIVLASYDAGIAHSFGLVARTTFRGVAGAGSLAINHSNPHFFITGQNLWALVGELVEKVGRTTGWTAGFVTSTCKTQEFFRTPVESVFFVCHDEAEYWSDLGDSGSGVYLWDFGTFLTAVGQHFGSRRDCISDPAECHYYGAYSNFNNINSSVGFLDVIF